MASEANLIFDPSRVADYFMNTNANIYSTPSWSNLVAQIQSAYPGVTCDVILSILPTIFEQSDLVSGVPDDGLTINLVLTASSFHVTDIISAGTMIVAIGETGGAQRVNTYTMSWDASGNMTLNSSIINVSSITFSTDMGLFVSSQFNPTIPNATVHFTTPMPAFTGSNDYQALLGCLIPACAISNPTLPKLGIGIKCANFSQIFNPFGINAG